MSNTDNIKNRFPIVFDGAMGTYYREKAEKPLPECEMANIFDRDTIAGIHREYLQAGADAIKTNTFGANTKLLKCSKEIRDSIITAAISIAREETEKAESGWDDFETSERKERFIFADIGPVPYSSGENEDRDELLKEYLEIADIFIENGIINFIFETLDETGVLPDVWRHIKKSEPDAFIISSFAVNPDGYTRKGFYCEDLLESAASSGYVDAVGFNCICGPGYILNTLRGIKLPDMPVSVMPNASYPTVVNNRLYYSNNPAYFANTCMDFLDYGVNIFGGCCGTTPAHIEKLVRKLDEIDNSEYAAKKISYNKIASIGKINSKSHKSGFYEKVCSGKKAIAVEMDPPADVNIEKYFDNLKILKKAGVDGVTIADCPVGRARIDSSLMAYKIKNELEMEPIVHLTCRDRNLNATKALLLGLNIESIKNIILVTGDPIPNAEKNEIKPVFNFNSRLLAKYVRDLNENLFTNKMIISSGLNINARNFDIELEKALRKEKSGVEVFYTQPVLSSAAIENLKKARNTLDAKIMGGIIPIVSYRNAVFMNEEISGITVENEIIDRYKGLDRENAEKLGKEISIHFIDRIYDYVDGYYLITPFNRVSIIEELVRHINSSYNK